MSAVKKVSVSSYEVVEDYTVYRILVAFPDATWTVCRRYSEFYALNEELTKKFGFEKGLIPSKRLVRSQQQAVIEHRKEALSLYIEQVCQRYQTLPKCVKIFLDFPRHDPLSITYDLARHLYTHGDDILTARLPVRLSSLQLFSISQRLISDSPTTEDDDKRSDIGHLFDVVYCLETLELLGTGSVLADNRLHLTQNLDLFKSITQLKLESCCLKQVVFAARLKDQLQALSVHKTISSCRELLYDWPTLDSITLPWNCLVTVSLRNNLLTGIDDSMKLLVTVEQLDLSSNRITVVENLQHMPRLRWLNLGHNEISSVHDLHLHLGNVTTLLLHDNCISSLAGLHRVFALESLNVSFNQLQRIGDISALKHLPSLEDVQLRGNPICSIVNYRILVLGQLLPTAVLDKQAASKQEKFRLAKLREEEQAHSTCNSSFSTSQEPLSPYSARNAMRAKSSARALDEGGLSADKDTDNDSIVVKRSTTAASKASRNVRITLPSSTTGSPPRQSPKSVGATKPKQGARSTSKQTRQGKFLAGLAQGGSEDLRQRLDALRVEGGASWLEMLNELYPQAKPTATSPSSLLGSPGSPVPATDQARKQQQRQEAKNHHCPIPLTPALLQSVSRQYSVNFQQSLLQAADEVKNSRRSCNFLVTNCASNEEVICSVDVLKTMFLEIQLASGQASMQHSLKFLQSLSFSEDLPRQITLTFKQLTRSETSGPGGDHDIACKDNSATKDTVETEDQPLVTVQYNLSLLQHLTKLLALLLPWSLAADALSSAGQEDTNYAVSQFVCVDVARYFIAWLSDEDRSLPGVDDARLSDLFSSRVAGKLGIPFEELLHVSWSSCQFYGTCQGIPCCVLISSGAIHLFQISYATGGISLSWLASYPFSDVTTINLALYVSTLRFESVKDVPSGMFPSSSFTLLLRDSQQVTSLVKYLPARLSSACSPAAPVASDDAGTMESLLNALSSGDSVEIGELVLCRAVFLLRPEDSGSRVIPVTFVLTTRFLFLLDEDYVHWPRLSATPLPPSTQRYQVMLRCPLQSLVLVEAWQSSDSTQESYPPLLPGLEVDANLGLQFDEKAWRPASGHCSNLHPSLSPTDPVLLNWRLFVPSSPDLSLLISSLQGLWQNQFSSQLALALNQAKPPNWHEPSSLAESVISSSPTPTKPSASRQQYSLSSCCHLSTLPMGGWTVVSLLSHYLNSLCSKSSEQLLFFCFSDCSLWSEDAVGIPCYFLLSSECIYLVRCLPPSRSAGDDSTDVPLSCHFSLRLEDLRHTFVSIFDQSIRFEGKLGTSQTFVCNLGDADVSNRLLDHLVVALQSAELSRSASGVPVDHTSSHPVSSATSPQRPISLYDGVADQTSQADQEMSVNGVHCQWPRSTHMTELYTTLANAARVVQASSVQSGGQRHEVNRPVSTSEYQADHPPAAAAASSHQPAPIQDMDLLYYQHVVVSGMTANTSSSSSAAATATASTDGVTGPTGQLPTFLPVSCSVAVTNTFLYLVQEDTQYWPIPSFLSDAPETHQYTVLAAVPVSMLRSVSTLAYGAHQVILSLEQKGSGDMPGNQGDSSRHREAGDSMQQEHAAASVTHRRSYGVISPERVSAIQNAREWHVCLRSYVQAEKLIRILQMVWSMNCDDELQVQKISLL